MAYLLDTNVVSELRRKSANEHVVEWQKSCELSELWISVLSMLEIRNGTERVRRSDSAFAQKLDSWYQNVLLMVYSGRILPVSLGICETRAALPADRTLPFTDGLIGATAKQHGLTLVTRNIKDFEGMGIELLNPWDYPIN
jgi:predicted nucleic acid-binding protein